MAHNLDFIVKTPRLGLREFTADDAEAMFALNTDQEVIRYTGDASFENLASAARFLETYDEYRKHGYGRWAVIELDSGHFVGWCGFKYHPDEHLTELGYRFFRKHWGKGYASEAAQACLDFGFRTLKLRVVYGFCHPENTRSEKVLRRAGMHYLRSEERQGHQAMRFGIWHPDFRLLELKTLQAAVVRHPVLREGRPFESAIFPEDEWKGTFHLGVIYEEVPVATVTLLIKEHAELRSAAESYQLRGMAVLPEFRKLSLGEWLVSRAEIEVRNRGGKLIWLNAREKAAGFYEKLGYQYQGDLFEMPGVGPHYLMTKIL